MTTETESVLCIGGSKDGQPLTVEKGARCVQVALYPKSGEMLAGRDIQIEEYHRIYFQDGDEELSVFVTESLKRQGVLGRLLACYHPGETVEGECQLGEFRKEAAVIVPTTWERHTELLRQGYGFGKATVILPPRP